MTIGQLAERAGVTAPTIRYYEEAKLLPRPARVSGRRVYDERTLERLQLITFAKQAGFTLAEIRQLFTSCSDGTPAAVRWKKLATAKLAEVEALGRRVEMMKKMLQELLRCGCIDFDVCAKILARR